MARSRRTEIPFGSDSFLDVVCNVVGIVVILVVIAGIFANRGRIRDLAAKANSRSTTTVAPLVEIPTPEPQTEPAFESPLPELTVAHEPQPAPLLEPESPPPRPKPRTLIMSGEEANWIPSAALSTGEIVARMESNEDVDTEDPTAAEMERLVEQAVELEDSITNLAAAGSGYRQEKSRWEEEAAQLKEQLTVDDSPSEGTDDERQQVLDLLGVVEADKQRIAQLEADVQQAKEKTGAVRAVSVIKHRLTPLAREVKGPEVHCRLLANEVSVVPFDVLIEMMRDHVQGHRQAILKSPRFLGTAGPIDGYHLSYVIEHQKNSLVEELRHGQTQRAALTSVTFQADPDLVTESPAEALTPNSRFLNAIDRVGTGVTVTLWVYPDSFDAHQKLKTALHRRGLNVASRPLPEGVPIAGSPEGSASAAE